MSERPLPNLLQRVAAALDREDARATFMEGLLLGAMIGAAIAGSTLWSRWRTRRSPRTK